MKTVRLLLKDVYVGLGAMVLVFLTAYSQNLLLTSFIRSLQSFVVFFFLSLIVRSLLRVLLQTPDSEMETRGTHVDYTTPEDDFADQFTPLNLPNVDEKKVNAEEMAQGVRTMSEQ